MKTSIIVEGATIEKDGPDVKDVLDRNLCEALRDETAGVKKGRCPVPGTGLGYRLCRA
jgi:hypothetical protein